MPSYGFKAVSPTSPIGLSLELTSIGHVVADVIKLPVRYETSVEGPSVASSTFKTHESKGLLNKRPHSAVQGHTSPTPPKLLSPPQRASGVGLKA